jgi:hypothetical protein
MNTVYVLGDIHGHCARMLVLLREAALIDNDDHWCAGAATLWCMGDFFDRGPDGVGAVEATMRLQREAQRAGGAVRALLGNHDALILAAYLLGNGSSGGPGSSFYGDWLRNGGVVRDIERMSEAHVNWLRTLPALAYEGDCLLMHADSTLYLEYGASVEEVNERFATLLHSADLRAWGRLLDLFSEHRAFAEQRPRGTKRFEDTLATFGVSQILHAHTPISKFTGQPAKQVRAPLLYQSGRCINVDGGIYLGGPGFVYQLNEEGRS